MEVTARRGQRKAQRRISVDGSGQLKVARGERGSGRAAGCAQLVIVGRRPVDEKTRRRIQQEGAGREWGRKERVGRFGGTVGRLGAPDT